MNLLGLVLGGLLRTRLAQAARAPRLRGDVGVEAGGMAVTLRFAADRVEVLRGAPERPRASIRGTLRALLDATLGRRRVRSWLAGRLRLRGGPLSLWRLAMLLRV